MIDKDYIYEEIRLAGYNYAKEYYVNWKEYFVADSDESWYKNSLDENGFPQKAVFSEQMGEQAWQVCICDCKDNNEFYETFGMNVSEFVAKEIEDGDTIYGLFEEGIDRFIKETY